MKNLTPRIRALIRQADKVAESGKRSAATKLYQQVIDEDPNTVEAWVGLSHVLRTQEEKEQALEKALELDPENASAERALAILRGEIPDEPESEEENESSDTDSASEEGEVSEPTDAETATILDSASESTSHQPIPEVGTSETTASVLTSDKDGVTAAGGVLGAKSEDTANTVEMVDQTDATVHSEGEEHEVEYVDDVLFCANHPGRQTHLRCNRCGKPICSSCAKRTPVGYRCPECIREQEDVFFTARPLDYLITVFIALPLSIIAGYIAPLIGFFVIFLAAGVGTLIGRLVLWAIGRRRGRWIPLLVGALVVIGAAVPYLLAFLDGTIILSLRLLWTGVYIVMAAGAAYYQMR
jgi:hypothetical protein